VQKQLTLGVLFNDPHGEGRRVAFFDVDTPQAARTKVEEIMLAGLWVEVAAADKRPAQLNYYPPSSLVGAYVKESE
jgi:hypothetical protein